MTQTSMAERSYSRIMKPFLEAAVLTLEMQCQYKVSPAAPYFKAGTAECPKDYVSCVSFSGQGFSATISFCTAETTAFRIAKRVIGADPKPNELSSILGEIMNIAYNNAKIKLGEAGITIGRGIPLIISGSKVAFNYLSVGEQVIIPLENPEGTVFLEIATERL
jgi:CheY-specific phosphatase CheX